MASIAFALPILPGKTEELRRLAEELNGPRRAEMQDLLRRAGASREDWYLQQTPQGDMAILYLEAEDIGRAFGAFIASTAPFDLWYKGQLLAIHGMDFNQPLPGPIAQSILQV